MANLHRLYGIKSRYLLLRPTKVETSQPIPPLNLSLNATSALAFSTAISSHGQEREFTGLPRGTQVPAWLQLSC